MGGIYMIGLKVMTADHRGGYFPGQPVLHLLLGLPRTFKPSLGERSLSSLNGMALLGNHPVLL
jgi:hypothetical protein